jgi:Phage integrase protein
MKTRLTIPSAVDIPTDFPDADALAALRAWYEGASSREAAHRYLHDRLSLRQSARGVIGQIRRQLALYARNRQRADLATLFECPAQKRMHHARATTQAVELLRIMPAPAPQIADDIAHWLPNRAVRTLHAAGIRTLADLTVRIPRRGSGGPSSRVSGWPVQEGSRPSLPRTWRSRSEPAH